MDAMLPKVRTAKPISGMMLKKPAARCFFAPYYLVKAGAKEHPELLST